MSSDEVHYRVGYGAQLFPSKVIMDNLRPITDLDRVKIEATAILYVSAAQGGCVRAERPR